MIKNSWIYPNNDDDDDNDNSNDNISLDQGYLHIWGCGPSTRIYICDFENF